MTPTQIELLNARKARLQRIAQAAARINPKTDSEFSAALNAVEEPTEAGEATPKDKWAEYQIEKHKPLWFSITRHVKVSHLKGPNIKAIQRATCDVYGVDLNDLLSERRSDEIVLPRHVSMYLAKKLTGLSSTRIARATGNRDHTTALHAFRKIENLIKTDDELAAHVAMIRERLNETVNRRNDASNTEMASQETARLPCGADSAGKAAICSAR